MNSKNPQIAELDRLAQGQRVTSDKEVFSSLAQSMGAPPSSSPPIETTARTIPSTRIDLPTVVAAPSKNRGRSTPPPTPPPQPPFSPEYLEQAESLPSPTETLRDELILLVLDGFSPQELYDRLPPEYRQVMEAASVPATMRLLVRQLQTPWVGAWLLGMSMVGALPAANPQKWIVDYALFVAIGTAAGLGAAFVTRRLVVLSVVLLFFFSGVSSPFVARLFLTIAQLAN